VYAKVVQTEQSVMSVALSGAVSLSCDAEEYSFDPRTGEIHIAHMAESGDCVHDALEEYGVTMDSIKWDNVQNRITVEMSYKLLHFTIDLEHDELELQLPQLDESTSIAEAYQLRFGSRLDESVPEGSYSGATSVFGQSVKGMAAFSSAAGTLDFSVSGAISLACDDEPYTYDGSGSISLTNEDVAGDCLHDSLEAYDATIDEVSYDAASNSVTVVVDAFLSISLTLQHVDGHGLPIILDQE